MWRQKTTPILDGRDSTVVVTLPLRLRKPASRVFQGFLVSGFGKEGRKVKCLRWFPLCTSMLVEKMELLEYHENSIFRTFSGSKA